MEEKSIETMFQTRPPGPRLNLAIGPSCPIRCEGCYNHFGESFSKQTLVSANEILDFSKQIRRRGIDGVTLSGGDPLLHPQIEEIINRLAEAGFRIKIDTVGTALLEDARLIYKGRGVRSRLSIAAIKDSVEVITLPLDGVEQGVVERFRKGRADLLQETVVLAELLRESGISLDFNTVANGANLNSLNDIGRLASKLGARAWHVFEYDSSGPNPSRHKDDLAVDHEAFRRALDNLGEFEGDSMILDLRTRQSRVGGGAYFFVNDSGEAWAPTGTDEARHFGNITRDREQVLAFYDEYLANFYARFSD